MKFTIATLALGLASTAVNAAKTPAQILAHVSPESVSCDPANDECRTNEQAAPYIFGSFCKYGIQNPNQMAAVISLVALESVGYQYKRNQFPGRPGQGTVNMQMAPYNLLYARSIPEIKDKVANMTDADVTEEAPAAEKNRMLDLLVPDEYNFASAAWFLRTQCGDSVLKALEDDLDAGYVEYLACIGVDPVEERLAYLELAKEAFEL